MKLIAKGDIKMAFNSVRATRWRSLLTTLGVVVGIASVVTVVSIGEGIKHQVAGQINSLGKDLITVRPGAVSTASGVNALAALSSPDTLGQASPLTNQDVKTVQNAPGVQLAVPLSVVPGQVTLGTQNFSGLSVIGSTPDTPSALNQSLQYGDFFSADESSPDVAVLGQNAANVLFPGLVPLGRSFSFHGQSFIVRGEFNQFDAAPLSIDTDFNNVIFIPYQTAEQLQNNNAPVYEILAKPTNPADVNAVTTAIQSQLLAAHSGSQDFSVLKESSSLAASSSILNLLTSLITAIAAISLIVGGIGIMDIMLVSVTERTREIGIRKAVGATNRQILSQFLIEAAMLSLFGGVAGVIVSLLANVVLRIFTNLQPLIVWQVMVLAAAVSLLVGVIFGIVPAIKAARKDPIDALRYQ
jgi:putative ABC transport system permease protein